MRRVVPWDPVRTPLGARDPASIQTKFSPRFCSCCSARRDPARPMATTQTTAATPIMIASAASTLRSRLRATARQASRRKRFPTSSSTMRSLPFPSAAPPPEILVEIVEDGAGALQPDLVLGMRHGDAVDQVLEAGVVRPPVLLVLQVDVVDDLPDGAQRRVGDLEARQQHLEGAELPLVGELTVEHVEAQLALAVAVVPRRDELELRLRVDAAPDEPGAGHAVHVDAGPGDPGRAHRFLQRSSAGRLLSRWPPGQLLLQLPEQALHRFAAARLEE